MNIVRSCSLLSSTIFLTALLYSHSCAASIIESEIIESNGGLARGTLLGAFSFGADGTYELLAKNPSLATADSYLAVTRINQPSGGSGSGSFTFKNIPLTYNDVTVNLDLSGTYQFQTGPSFSTVFTFDALPDILFDLGTAGFVTVSTVSLVAICNATQACGPGGLAPRISANLPRAVPEPSTVILLGIGLLGLSFRKRNAQAD